MSRVGVLGFLVLIYFPLLVDYVCYSAPFPPHLNDYSELQKWVINHGAALYWCDYSAPSCAGITLGPGSGISVFCANQYSINVFSLPKLLKLFSPQMFIILSSSYTLLIVVSLTQVTPWLYAVLANINVFFPNKTASNCLSCVWAIVHMGTTAITSIKWLCNTMSMKKKSYVKETLLYFISRFNNLL